VAVTIETAKKIDRTACCSNY